MRLGDKLFLRSFFKTYYILYNKKISGSIKEIQAREFAYIDFNGVMYRHISLRNDIFNSWLIENVPRDFYHSSAYYLFPDKPMEDKVWSGGDLIFDIDLDHIPTYTLHKIFMCRSCGEISEKEPVYCPICGERGEEIILVDSEGYKIAKKELLRLLEILERDFGIPIDDNIHIYFSGSRGFHLHVLHSDIIVLDQRLRLEIKDYITLDAFDILYTRSLRTKIIEQLIPIIKKYIQEPYRSRLLQFIEEDNLHKFRDFFKQKKEIRNMINEITRKQLGIHIDGIVTVDTSRLIRAPFSLHGTTGMIKMEISYDNIDNFDPFSDAVFDSKDTVNIYVRYMPETIWLNKSYPETHNTYITVPSSLAAFLIGKRLAYNIKRI